MTGHFIFNFMNFVFKMEKSMNVMKYVFRHHISLSRKLFSLNLTTVNCAFLILKFKCIIGKRSMKFRQIN